jgi:hypothetical protein
MSKIVVIEDGTIFTMIADQQLATEIPCLQGKKDIFKGTSSGCGSCAKQRNARRRDEINKIKACIAALSAEKRAKLKTWLAADQVRIMHANAAGQVIQVNF